MPESPAKSDRPDDRRPRRIGLTGGIGSGKSMVSALLADRGAIVVDADRLAREVVAPGTAGFDAVVAAFGPSVVGDDGALDRAALGQVVFADPDKRHELEAIIHPQVRAEAARIEAAAPPGAVVIHDIPLLVETGQPHQFDAVIVVDAPEDTQIDRLTTYRGMTRTEATARIRAQADPTTRLGAATHVVRNDATVADLRARVDQVWDELTSGR